MSLPQEKAPYAEKALKRKAEYEIALEAYKNNLVIKLFPLYLYFHSFSFTSSEDDHHGFIDHRISLLSNISWFTELPSESQNANRITEINL